MNKNINHFKVIGISHHLADVENRERFTLSDAVIPSIHQFLINRARGGFVLSTCNRTEIYFIDDDSTELIAYWAGINQVSIEELSSFLYEYSGKQAIEYLFRVGSGLDSQILGDFQIIGQIKSAYQRAIKQGAGNNKITRLIDVLLKTSKRVKNETNLSSGVASMAYAAIQHAQSKFDLSQKKIFVYGAGKMGFAVTRKLAEIIDSKQVFIANRTEAKAQEFSTRFGVQFVENKQRVEAVSNCDVLISTAAVDDPIFTVNSLKNIDLSDKLFIDLSMPRSIDAALMEETDLVNLDYLTDVQNETFEKRKQSIPAAESIVEEELSDFYAWIEARDFTPTIHAIKEKLHIYKDVEINRLRKTMPELQQEQIELVAEALINKVATQCIKHVKRNDEDGIQIIQDLFEVEA